MRMLLLLLLGLVWTLSTGVSAQAQALGQPARGEPGDRMIQDYLERVTNQIDQSFSADLATRAEWESRRGRYRDEYFYMLGLAPLPERTPLKPTVTGTLTGEGFAVDMLHYQSRPGLYVTGNLYRPAVVKEGERLPAVFYVCGHSQRDRDGNKTAYQSHGIWFARHGYICLIVDTLQLGEIAAIHHGTYNRNRWWWHARGYTPAGVECWNGIRGIDYLVGRPDVDPERIAVSGISGGGAVTFWIAAADERVKVAIPVSGMADLRAYVPNRVINGHCDCMFLYNTFEWPWTRIAALVAPRPLLFVNSDQDAIFPMDANERISALLERVYSLYGAGERVDTVVSVGGHAYRQDIRQSAYRFMNCFLKGDACEVLDSERDLVIEPPGVKPTHPLDPQKLRVFPTDSAIPADQLNTTIDEHFVPLANPAAPTAEGFETWKKQLLAELRRVTFRPLPERIPAAKVLQQETATIARLETEAGITVRLESTTSPAPGAAPTRILLVVRNAGSDGALPPWLKNVSVSGDQLYRCEPRGTGDTRWTGQSPPNYVERSHVLLGRTVDTGRVWDVIATARHLREVHKAVPIHVVAEGAAGVIATYAALLEPEIAGVICSQPPLSHMETAAPQFLNVLRVADIPELFGLLAPRPLTILGDNDPRLARTKVIYAAAGTPNQFSIEPAKAP